MLVPQLEDYAKKYSNIKFQREDGILQMTLHTKEAVNVAEDAQGRVQAMQTSFALHQLAHTHWLEQYGVLLDPSGLPPETARAMGARLKKQEG